jgi:isopentenyl-diphosphate delta-isomerase
MTDDEEQVILVDAADLETGRAAKSRVHQTGERHRAVSVFIADRQGRILLQRRAASKYHSAGQWANTCCSHPRPGESTAEAARRRLREEMGIDCDLEAAGVFTYRADVGGGLVEHEVDHLFFGRHEGEPVPDRREVDAWRWEAPLEIDRLLATEPERFAPWFAPAWIHLKHAVASVAVPDNRGR